MSHTDPVVVGVLVIGGGLAGERAAVAAAEAGLDVLILSLVPPRRSHTAAAQGGMQAALGNHAKGAGDGPDLHFLDTVKGSDWGCDQDVARLFVQNAPVAVRQMAAWGVPWNRVVAGRFRAPNGDDYENLPEQEGLITARDFGGTAKWRACFTADGTGHSVMYAMDSVVARMGIRVHDRMEALALIHDGHRCFGAVARCLRTGELKACVARATIIATGGYGRLYGASTNALINEATGMAIALDTGVVPLGNMEAVQFHPTGLVPSSILITEGARGDGGHLLDRKLHRFMPDYEPAKKELASRDVVSRRMVEHMRKGLGVEGPDGLSHVWLDIRHLGRAHIETNLREIQGICRNFMGIDPVDELIPVRPTQHYSMGGVRTDIDGAAYGLAGLYAVGEAACWDLHGFNRLGGNSLAETVTAGMIVGPKAAEFAAGAELACPMHLVLDSLGRQRARIDDLIGGRLGKENPYELRPIMEDTLFKQCHVFRNGPDLERAVATLLEVEERSRHLGLRTDGFGASNELGFALRFPGMVRVALCIAYGALQRTESRGSHAREDHPRRDDANWLKRTLARWERPEQSLPTLTYEPVKITELPPGDRGYGERQVKQDAGPAPAPR